MKKFIAEFKEFAFKGSVFDLAVGIIMGGAISALVTSMVKDILTPIIGLVLGQPDFSAITLGPVMIGSFINALVAFVILAFVLYLLIKGVNRFKKPAPEAPPAPSNQELLLAEIRDLLKTKK